MKIRYETIRKFFEEEVNTEHPEDKFYKDWHKDIKAGDLVYNSVLDVVDTVYSVGFDENLPPHEYNSPKVDLVNSGDYHPWYLKRLKPVVNTRLFKLLHGLNDDLNGLEVVGQGVSFKNANNGSSGGNDE